MYATDIKLGDKVYSVSKGDGIIIERTPRTATAKFEFVTSKWTFKKDCSLFELGIIIKTE